MRLENGLCEKLKTLPARLKSVLIGQDAVIDAVCERLRHGELGLSTPGRPRASFLFLGPTGVGKTEITLRFTEELIGAGKVVRLDMSEYQTVERLALLLGASDDEPGRIAEGFDACGGNDGGRGTWRLTTGRNRVLDFSNWYCVLTSNIGARRIMTLRKSKYETMERLVRQDAQRELRPEIFARITVTAVFNRLDYDAQRVIARGMIARECAALLARGFAIEPDHSTLDVIIQRGYHERLGARPMRDATELLIRNALAHSLLDGGNGSGCLRAHPDGRQLQFETATPEAAALPPF